MKMLARHVVFGKGVFVTGKDNHYSYCQPLTVRDPTPFVAWLNEVIGEHLIDVIHAKRGDEKTQASILDEETRRMLEQGVQKKFPFLRLEPGRIAFTVPGTRTFFTAVKRDVLGGSIEKIKKDVDDLLDPATRDKVNLGELRKQIESLQWGASFLANTPWSFDQRSDQITVALGWGAGQPFRLVLESERRAAVNQQHNADLYAFAKTLGARFRNDVPIDQVLDEFQRNQMLATPGK